MSLSVDTLRNTITSELDVLEDDIHETSDGNGLTFYLPLDKLRRSRELLGVNVEVIETHEYEYLVKATL